MSVVVTGTYNRTIRRDWSLGYTQFTFHTREQDIPYRNRHGDISCNGNIPDYVKGVPLRIEGEFVKTPRGMELRCDKVSDFEDTEQIMVSYLRVLAKGVGQVTAKAIYDFCQPDGIFAFCQKEDAALKLSTSGIRGLKADTIKAIVRGVKSSGVERNLLKYLVANGGTAAQTARLMKEYGDNALTVLKSDPYKAGKAGHIPFATCDRIARENGLKLLDQSRLDAIADDALANCTSSGSCYTTFPSFKREADRTCLQSGQPVLLPPPFYASGCLHHEDIVLEEDGKSTLLFTRAMYEREKKAANELVRLNTRERLPWKAKLVDEAAKESGVKLTKEQKDAAAMFKTAGVKILTGGPGTGKTTTELFLIRLFEMMNPDAVVKLCAPTGRASQRMAEATGREAATVHRMLEYKLTEGGYTHKDADDPVDADFVILDEASMLDVELFAILLPALKTGTTLLLVGDTDQLPSVGPGNVLHDLIEAKDIAGIDCCRLTEIFRQAAGSPIIRNAIRIRDGVTALEETKDYQMLRVQNDAGIVSALENVVLSPDIDSRPEALQVLSTSHQGDASIEALNERMQVLLNPNSTQGDADSFLYAGVSFYIGDKVMMTANNYAEGYYNGDTGKVTGIHDRGFYVQLDNGKELCLEKDLLDDVQLAYAVSIHKSQGSEYKTVVICLPEDPGNMLQRNLLYTAVTRGQQRVVIISTNDAQEKAIMRQNDASARKTRLKERIQEAVLYREREENEQKEIKRTDDI